MAQLERLTDKLKEHFGYEQFRPEQIPLVERIHNGLDLLGIMPTGKGKSACFQIPALFKPGVTVVITPLLALMHDQVQSLEAKNIKARAITGNTPYPERDAIFEGIRAKQIKLLYVTPELFCRGDFAGKFGANASISMMVFDEAHCLSLWGDDFRPAYVRAAQMAQVLSGRYVESGMPPIQFVALTATATPTIESQLCNILQIKPQNVYKTDLSRPNIRFVINPVENSNDRLSKLIAITKHYTSKGFACVIYTNTRRNVETITQTLRMVKVNAAGFHAGIEAHEKARIQAAFLNDEISIVVATVAFGMGIDKPNIRAVIHHQAPRSLEDYYQQVGRAGRDGYPAVGHLLFNYDSELSQAIELINGSTPTSNQLRSGYDFMLSLYSGDGTSAHVQPDVLAGAININRAKASMIIEQLIKFAVIRQIAPHQYQVRRLDDFSVLDAVDTLNKVKLEKIKKMMEYGDAPECKQNLVLNYFGQYPEHKCGQCSYCKAPNADAGKQTDASASDDKVLRASLVALRNELAKAIRVPPFSIMSEKCIDNMVEHKPLETEGFISAGMHSMHARVQAEKVRSVIARYVSAPAQAPASPNLEVSASMQSDSQVDIDTSQAPER